MKKDFKKSIERLKFNAKKIFFKSGETFPEIFQKLKIILKEI